jgi:radical SAM protein with 4Fe4S-binding SPASM domain
MESHLRIPWSLRLKERLVAPIWRTYQHLETDLHPLHYLFWEATLRCNLACRHCGSDCRHEPQGPELAGDQVMQVLRDIAAAYQAKSIVLVATGGEPLLRPDLLTILAQAHALGFPWGIVTNGWLVDAKIARRCREEGMTSVVVSLDGPQASHEWLRQRKGSFARAIQALQLFRTAGIRIVEAITCVHPANINLLDSTYDLIRATGATHWRIFTIFPKGRVLGEPGLLLDASKLRDLLGSVAALKQRGKKDGLVVNFSEEGYLHPCLDVQIRDSRYFCRAGINVAGLLADGAVAACPNLPRHLVQGSVLEQSFPDIWEQKYQRFRDRSWMKTGICASCRQWKDCRGNSLHGYDWEKKQPSRCHFAETLPIIS